jgi:hypothetical protein
MRTKHGKSLASTTHGAGYKGEDARRIWAAIYEQPAIRDAAAAATAAAAADSAPTAADSDNGGGKGSSGAAAEAVAPEQLVLYRLISGMHASITASIVQNFYHAESGAACGMHPMTACQAAYQMQQVHAWLDRSCSDCVAAGVCLGYCYCCCISPLHNHL